MKTSILKTITAGILAITAMTLVSCQSSVATPPTSAVSCSKCGTIHFKAPFTKAGSWNKGIVTLHDASRMSCPDCENKVVAMLKGGSVTRHTCASCGGTLNHCTGH